MNIYPSNIISLIAQHHRQHPATVCLGFERGKSHYLSASQVNDTLIKHGLETTRYNCKDGWLRL